MRSRRLQRRRRPKRTQRTGRTQRSERTQRTQRLRRMKWNETQRRKGIRRVGIERPRSQASQHGEGALNDRRRGNELFLKPAAALCTRLQRVQVLERRQVRQRTGRSQGRPELLIMPLGKSRDPPNGGAVAELWRSPYRPGFHGPPYPAQTTCLATRSRFAPTCKQQAGEGGPSAATTGRSRRVAPSEHSVAPPPPRDRGE